MPIIQLKRRTMNMWRGRLDPRRPALWWSNHRAELKRLASLAEQEGVERLVIGAELYITEYGYPALASALARPWDETTSAAYDAELQAELVTRVTSLLHTRMSERGALRGASLWNWFGFGGRRDKGYTLRGRPGQEALRALIRAHESAAARAASARPLIRGESWGE